MCEDVRCSVCGEPKTGDGWLWWGGVGYCRECLEGGTPETCKKETEKLLCHVCGEDVTETGCGVLNNDRYCLDCFRDVLKKEDVARAGKCDTTTADMKSSNPKDLAAVTRVPMHLWPMTATVHGCVAIYEGMRKYGYYNWRHDKVSIMTYVAALQRHLFRYVCGQWEASDSGASHLGHILACAAILVDAHESGQTIDDRPIAGPDVERLMEQMEKVVEETAERHKDKHPTHHYRGSEEAE